MLLNKEKAICLEAMTNLTERLRLISALIKTGMFEDANEALSELADEYDKLYNFLDTIFIMELEAYLGISLDDDDECKTIH